MRYKEQIDFYKRLRLYKRINQTEIANHLGFTQAFISQIESGKREIRYKDLVKYMEFIESK